MNKIKYKKIPFFETIIKATYKGIIASIAEGKEWVSIYSIESKNKNKGEANEFIKLLKQDYPNKVFWSSIPLNPIWKHLCDKFKIKYLEENDK
jgi:hypothetical protein